MGLQIGDIVPREAIEFSQLKGKTIAVDAYNTIYQFLSTIRQPDGTPLMDKKGNITSHLSGLFYRNVNLLLEGIKLIYVFDGKPPLLKLKTQEEREHRKQIAEKKLKEAMEEEDVEAVLKYSKQTTRLSREILDESKELIEAMGMPVIQAPSEAEAQASFICENNDVYAVATSDFDALLYGCPRMLTNLTVSQRKKLPSGSTVKISPTLIELSDTLNHLGITLDQLLALAILVGTDYNEGVHRIGAKTALKLVKQHKNFDILFKEVKAEFNWKEIYAVFKSMPIMKNYKLKWNYPDEKKIKEILVEKHDFSEERVDKTLSLLLKNKKKEQTGLGKWA